MSATPEAGLQRRFSVHGLEEGPARTHLVDGVSFEDAALAYLEDRHLEETHEVALLVEDCATGERQCFSVDLTTGATTPCD
ncbi:MAG TPA: DUF5961 family protein [Phenylobacterium sp.]